jgi:hypothetical protein
MNAARVVVEGTLRPDGSLEVAEKLLGLPPGRVRVTVELLDESPSIGEDWFAYLRRARSERESAGADFRSREKIDDAINALRDEWDQP